MTRKNTFHALDEDFAAAAEEFFAGRLEKTDREDAELSILLDTLQRVDEAFSDDKEAEARERIRKNLHKAWFAEEEKKTAKRPGILSTLRDFFWQNRQQTGLALSFAMILLVLVMIPFLLSNNLSMAATAGTINPTKASLLAVMVIVFVSALLWALKRKQ